METYNVANIEEAVELGNQLKEKGLYNWFRGQVRDWKPVSSFFRIQETRSQEKEDAVRERIRLFCDWLRKTPGLEYLLQPDRVNDCYAIMQHYGIPTHYIDFTTDPSVAGYFAADTIEPPQEGHACIYCLNTDDLLSLWKVLATLDERKGAEMELVSIDVTNLWRLQAQYGVFLYCNYDWSMDYPMDRILFPYSGFPSFPTKDRIYPENKRPLEQLILRYLDLENRIEGEKWLDDLLTGLRVEGRPAPKVVWKTFADGYYQQAFAGSLPQLESWSKEAIKSWLVAPEEDYHQTIGPSLSLRIADDTDSATIGRVISFGIRQALRSDPNLRLKTVSWELSGNSSFFKKGYDPDIVSLCLEWNSTFALLRFGGRRIDGDGGSSDRQRPCGCAFWR